MNANLNTLVSNANLNQLDFKPSKTTATSALSDRNFNVFKGAGGSLAGQEFYPEIASASGNYG